ncbi:MAG: hypothetical protein U0797_27430 [Gemmataceae bacterium]
MTVVGKILVFLNLVFSLVVGGFAVVDYAARTHWAKAFDDVTDQNKKLRAIAESYKNDADRVNKEKADLHEQLTVNRVAIDPALKDAPDAGSRIASLAVAELRARAKAIDEQKTTVESLRKQLADEKTRNVGYLNMERAMKTDTERRVLDTKVLRDTLKLEMDKNFKMEQEKNQMRDDMVTAQIAAKALKDRNTQMETQLQDLARNLAQMKANTGAAAPGGRGANPPPENIEGQVNKVDGRLVSISVGADNGLSPKQTMEVFRLGQNPRYIGRIRLIDVNAKSAVGTIEGKTTMSIQAGDKVASRILGGY